MKARHFYTEVRPANNIQYTSGRLTFELTSRRYATKTGNPILTVEV